MSGGGRLGELSRTEVLERRKPPKVAKVSPPKGSVGGQRLRFVNKVTSASGVRGSGEASPPEKGTRHVVREKGLLKIVKTTRLAGYETRATSGRASNTFTVPTKYDWKNFERGRPLAHEC